MHLMRLHSSDSLHLDTIGNRNNENHSQYIDTIVMPFSLSLSLSSLFSRPGDTIPSPWCQLSMGAPGTGDLNNQGLGCDDF